MNGKKEKNGQNRKKGKKGGMVIMGKHRKDTRAKMQTKGAKSSFPRYQLLKKGW